MQFVRMLFWVLVLAALIIFTAFNWTSVEVRIWTNLVLETKVPALVIIAFLLGLVPTWLLHRGTRWRLNRRISALETAARSNAVNSAASTPPPPPVEPVDADSKPSLG